MAGLPHKHTPSRVTQGVLPPISQFPWGGGAARSETTRHPPPARGDRRASLTRFSDLDRSGDPRESLGA